MDVQICSTTVLPWDLKKHQKTISTNGVYWDGRFFGQELDSTLNVCRSRPMKELRKFQNLQFAASSNALATSSFLLLIVTPFRIPRFGENDKVLILANLSQSFVRPMIPFGFTEGFSVVFAEQLRDRDCQVYPEYLMFYSKPGGEPTDCSLQ